jgi:hypothetical protein
MICKVGTILCGVAMSVETLLAAATEKMTPSRGSAAGDSTRKVARRSDHAPNPPD